METELTKAIKAALWKFTDKQGTFGCEEVSETGIRNPCAVQHFAVQY